MFMDNLAAFQTQPVYIEKATLFRYHLL